MNFDNLLKQKDQLLTHMTNIGYSNRYVCSIKQVVKYIEQLEPDNNYTSYKELYDTYLCHLYPERSLGHLKSYVSLIEDFHINDNLPNGMRRITSIKVKNAYDRLCPGFKSLVDASISELKLRNRSEVTIQGRKYQMSSFLWKIQETGIRDIADISRETIFEILLDQNGDLRFSPQAIREYRRGFKDSSNTHPEANRIYQMIPPVKLTRKNPKYLTDGELKRIDNILASKSGLSKKEIAVVTLLRYTGMRAGDVAALTVDCIDWENERIHFSQSKTSNQTSIPLSTTVGNAIYDYISEERGISSEPYLFLSSSHPYSKLTTTGIRVITAKIFKMANVQQGENGNKGTHMFRRTLATKMLEANTPLPVISEVLGHSSPESINPYLGVDMIHLKECALSVELFSDEKEEY